MIEYLIAYAVGALAVCSIMMWWFNTMIHLHLIQILRSVGFRKDDPGYWYSDTPFELWTSHDFDMWKMQRYPAWLDELTSCKGCFSFHVSFWTAVVASAICWAGIETLIFTLACVSTWPFIGNIGLAALNNLDNHG